VYKVRPGGRVADVLDAAGGPAPDADVDQLNLAAKVADGERVYVPRRGEAPPPVAGAGPGAAGAAGAPAAAVDLNTATLDQLETLPGVGPSIGQAILDYRREHGRFKRVEELVEVRGIGEARLAALRAKVRV
jgi:competence protein ComEA